MFWACQKPWFLIIRNSEPLGRFRGDICFAGDAGRSSRLGGNHGSALVAAVGADPRFGGVGVAGAAHRPPHAPPPYFLIFASAGSDSIFVS